MRKPSDPDIRELIVVRIKEKGANYTPPKGKVVYPGARHEERGLIIRAGDVRRLREEPDLEQIPLTKFRKALGSLMYHHRQVARCHIDGKRHFKLLAV